jgi:hypothetical protein
LDKPIEIFAMAKYKDQIKILRDAGAQYVFSLYEEMGKGMADDIISKSQSMEVIVN